jgi:hypothetical protein
MKAGHCIKCEQKIKIVAQRPTEEAYNYGEFPRWVMFHGGEIDRGASGIKVRFQDPATQEVGVTVYGRLCERCMDDLAQKEIVRTRQT